MIKQILRKEVTTGSKFGLSPNKLNCLALNPRTGDSLNIAKDDFWHVYLFNYTLSQLSPETEVYVDC